MAAHRFVAQGNGSVVSLPLLTSLISGQGGYTSMLETTVGGEVDTPDLTTLSDVSLTFSGGSLNLVGLTTIVGSSIAVSGGVVLSLPAKSYTGGSGYNTTLSATGSGSELELPDLTTWEGGTTATARRRRSVRPRAGRCRCRP